LTEEDIKAALANIQRKRGIKKTDSKLQLKEIKELIPQVSNRRMKIDMYMLLVTVMFDAITARHIMRPKYWNDARKALIKIIRILNKNPGIVANATAATAVHDGPSSSASASSNFEEDSSNLLLTNIAAFIKMLDDQFTKALQQIDPHSRRYVKRLKDESHLVDLAKYAQELYEKVKNKVLATRMAAIRVEHIYYKLDAIAERIEEARMERNVVEENEAKKKRRE